MTPVPCIRPACGPNGSICLDSDSGAELVPRFWSNDPTCDAEDFHCVERGEVPPLERFLARRPSGGRWPSWARPWATTGHTGKQLAVARAARAAANGGGDGERHRWQDLIDLCISERLDLSCILAAVPRLGDASATLPARLLYEERGVALGLLLPHLRRGAWGAHACLGWREGSYFGGAGRDGPEGDGLWRGEDGTLVRGAWRLGKLVGPGLWRQGARLWRGPMQASLARHGRGELTLADGTRVRGCWADGQLAGDALVLWPDRRRYYGPLASEAPAVPHGLGRCDGADGSRTEGRFERGVLAAQGTFTYPPGATLAGWRYVGPFVAGRKHGRGYIEPAQGAQGRPARPRQLVAVYEADRLVANSPAGRALAHLGRAAMPPSSPPPGPKSGAPDLL